MALAAEFGERGARVVSVSPGSFDTEMGRLEEDHGAGDLVKAAAIKRLGKPEEVAAVLAFCASEAPGYLTGVDILVDGGTRAGRDSTRPRKDLERSGPKSLVLQRLSADRARIACMFDSLELRAEGLGSAAILQAARDIQLRRIAVENEQLVIAAAWADANPAESIHPDQLALNGGPRGIRPGGEGTPEVNDLAVVTYGAAVQKSHTAAKQYIGHALDLRHRHPLLWGKLMRCEVIAWQGCLIAQLTHDLTLDQARWVDREVARFAGVVPWPKLRDRVEAAIMKVDADRIEQHAKDRRSRLGVWMTQPDDDGLRGIYGRLEPHDAIRLFGRINDLADCLPAGTGTADQHRAAGFAMLGNELQAMKLMAHHRQPDLFEQELALAVQPVDGEPDDPIEESEVHPALRDRPVVPDFDEAVFKAAVDRIVDGLDLDKLMPKTTLVVHLAAESLADGQGICRVPGIGPTTMGVIKHWLGHHRVKVRPVIDLNDPPPPVDTYEIPDRHKRQVQLRHPASTFPWSTEPPRV